MATITETKMTIDSLAAASNAGTIRFGARYGGEAEGKLCAIELFTWLMRSEISEEEFEDAAKIAESGYYDGENDKRRAFARAFVETMATLAKI